MKRYRKKPLIVKAIEITDSMFDADHPNDELIKGVRYDPGSRHVYVSTGHGEAWAGVGDFLVRDVAGVLSPVKRSVFLETHAELDDVAEDEAQREISGACAAIASAAATKAALLGRMVSEGLVNRDAADASVAELRNAITVLKKIATPLFARRKGW